MFNRISQHLGVPADAPVADQAREAAVEVTAQAREGLERALASARDQIVRHPARSLAVALALGAMVGWFIKRR